ncbi:MAG: O-methyltransferase, partial [Thermoplasmata archaeon]|jgi:predicted O-methyltransferase YrrM|nr:O-methyltransferase [Thermoplasmata archaeon]
MKTDRWSAVDDYLEERLLRPDAGLEAALASAEEAHLPAIQVSPLQGKLLHLLARAQGARRVLEIGTLGGYSAIWLAKALPSDGQVVTLELNPAHATVAQKNLARAGVDHLVEVRVGPAIDSLAKLAAESSAPFDFVFVDADKPNIPTYLEWAVRLGRPGTVVVVDNVVRNGAVADAATGDPNVDGVRRMHDAIAMNPRIEATTIQTVGSKGYDGFTIAVVGPP